MINSDKNFRRALGRFTTGVCIVGAVNERQESIGMTINSFSSVSLEPSIVLWSLKKDSMCYEMFAGSSKYSISVLSQDQGDISSRYAKAGNHLMLDSDFYLTDERLPVVKGSLAHFECESWSSLRAGDHDVILAKVVRYSDQGDGEPLVFYGGGYRELRCSGMA